MIGDWIETLKKEYDAMHPAQAKQANARDAFARVQAEMRKVAAKLNKQFERNFRVNHLFEEDPHWSFEIEGAPGPWIGTTFRFDEQDGTIATDSSANVSMVPSDHHEFELDRKTGQFTENGQTVTDDELVRRAIDQFLKSALGMN